MREKQSVREIIRSCVEAGLGPEATIDFLAEVLKRRIQTQASRTYPTLLAKKLLASGMPSKEAHSQVTWALIDLGSGVKAAEKRASKLVGWRESEPYRVRRVGRRR